MKSQSQSPAVTCKWKTAGAVTKQERMTVQLCLVANIVARQGYFWCFFRYLLRKMLDCHKYLDTVDMYIRTCSLRSSVYAAEQGLLGRDKSV